MWWKVIRASRDIVSRLASPQKWFRAKLPARMTAMHGTTAISISVPTYCRSKGRAIRTIVHIADTTTTSGKNSLPMFMPAIRMNDMKTTRAGGSSTKNRSGSTPRSVSSDFWRDTVSFLSEVLTHLAKGRCLIIQYYSRLSIKSQYVYALRRYAYTLNI